MTAPAALAGGLSGTVLLLHHLSHHGDGGVDRGGGGGGGPGVAGAGGGGGGRGHSVLGLPGHVDEESPHAVCCHGGDQEKLAGMHDDVSVI